MKQQQAKVESRALRYGMAAIVLSAVVAVVWFWGGVAPLFGPDSVGSVSSVLTAAAVFVGFLLAFRAPPPKHQGALSRARGGLTTAALAFIHAGIGLLLTVVAYYLIQTAFEGVQLDHWTAAGLAALTAGGGGYAAYLAGAHMTSLQLSATLAAFMVSGVLASMISAPNPYWWEIHFSSLGGGESASAAAFNLTLFIGGLAIVGLADLVASDFARWQAVRSDLGRVKVNVLRLFLATIGVLLACVGVFAYDTNLAMHNFAAGGMSTAFLILTLILPWVAPGLSKSFYLFSYGLLGALLGCMWLFNSVGYLNLTSFEMLAAGTIFAWVIVFVRQIAAGLADTALVTT